MVASFARPMLRERSACKRSAALLVVVLSLPSQSQVRSDECCCQPSGNARKFQPIPGFQAVRLIRGGEELVQSWEVSLRRPARCGGDGQGEDPSAANDATVLDRPR